MRESRLKCYWKVVGAFLMALGGLQAAPNIVVFLCDDLGYGDLSCQGHPHIKTPHLDQMAKDGIRYTSGYSASPVCSPSRVGLLTGRTPNRAGVYDWIPEYIEGVSKRKTPRRLVHLRKGEFTIPELLKKAGYQTCVSGKWHCNAQFNNAAQSQPQDFYFDHWFATQNNAAPSHENPVNFVRNGEEVGMLEGYSANLVVEEAISWLERREKEKPFFIYVPFHEPHEPVASPAKMVEGYKEVARNEDEAQYFANVENVDAAVGAFLEYLREKNLEEETLVIFTSDNGPETLNRYKTADRSYGVPGPLRGMKLHTHEAGYRVALLMQWKGKIAPAQVSDHPVSALDFLPTFAALSGGKMPESRHLDGADLQASWEGQAVERSQPLYWCYLNSLSEPKVAMRDGKWKLLGVLEGLKDTKIGSRRSLANLDATNAKVVKAAKFMSYELYDLSADLGEKVDLAGKLPEKVEELAKKMEAIHASVMEEAPVWEEE